MMKWAERASGLRMALESERGMDLMDMISWCSHSRGDKARFLDLKQLWVGNERNRGNRVCTWDLGR